MTEEKFNSELARIRQINKDKAQRYALWKEKHNWKEKKSISTTKLIALYLFIVLNAILIFSCVAMWHFADLSTLGLLITDIAAQILVYLLYVVKATKENTVGGITYEKMMHELDSEDDEDAVG